MEELSPNEIEFKEWAYAWLNLNAKLRKINKVLYERTEWYEHGYERNFDKKLHNFFAKKITRFKKEENELFNLLPEKIMKQIVKEAL